MAVGLAVAAALVLPRATGAQTAPVEPEPEAERATAISGYMDFHFNKQEFQDARLDFHRFVLLVNHTFSDRIRFVSELELEHALVEGLEEAGELELEQAYVDFLLSRRFNVRAGMMLMPVGIINERHEPPVFYGVERPYVDTVIIPTTWFEVGAGVHGELGRGWRYRTFVASPLNAREFSAEEGLRGGRQKGSDTNIGRPAVTGRFEYVGVPGLTVGASFWTGRSGFEFRPRFDVPVAVGDADVRYSRDRLELRGEFARVAIRNAGELNDALGRAVGVDPNIASALRGFYGEAGYRVISGASFGDVGVFARYENFDTQFRMPANYVPAKAFDRDAWVVGFTYWPDADVALKFDYSAVRNQSATIKAPNSLNIGLGWWF
jgi:Phosphate-selective porin O and P